MGRFLAGVAAAMLLMTGGLLLWRSVSAADPVPLPTASAGLVSPVAAEPLPEPPQASEKTREEKRFARYDRDKDGKIGRDEYLLARRKAFAKLDTNGDGRLSFEEYAIKTSEKFGKADADKSGALNVAEFATTRVVRKTPPPRANCPPQQASRGSGDEED